MTDNMVWFDKADARFMLVTRGIIIHKDRVLLFNVIGWDWWALPGGRIEILEMSQEALQREIQEELGTDARIGRLVWVVENYFNNADRKYHEVGLYYRVTLSRNANIMTSEEHTCADGPVRLRFRWFPVSGLENINLRPAFLKTTLLKLPTHTGHIVWYDG